MMKKIVIGLIAHVDAGKTTLSEAMLYLSGKINRLGRVDHRDTCLDTHGLERQRGITIFAKEASFTVGDSEFTLLDTPGHADFAAETERALQVLDYAVLVISGSDGVQAHTETLWRLLRRYRVPTIIFVSKIDMVGFDKEKILSDLKKRLSERCLDFSVGGDPEEIAVCDDALLEGYLETNRLTKEEVGAAIAKETLFPVYFGSGLKLNGVAGFLDALDEITVAKDYPATFGARVYKLGRDSKNHRLTYMKITGGSLKLREAVSYRDVSGESVTEKADRLYFLAAGKQTAVTEVSAGMVCAVQGFSKTVPGMGLGLETGLKKAILEPVLTYRLCLPPEVDPRGFFPQLCRLEEEFPELRIVWDETFGDIRLRLMGNIQIEVVESLIAEEFGIDATVDEGRIIYKETIAEPVVGMGHFEPLRHYAEVHLLLEPLAPGSGLVFDSQCSEDILDKNWQRLILSQLKNQMPPGVLIGAALTDMRITLIAGRAHQKHTEGGDFLQAATRALRHGLMQGKCRLLEPCYSFVLRVPDDCLGRAIRDIQEKNGKFSVSRKEKDFSLLRGTAPVSALHAYAAEVASYTHGKGSFTCSFQGYAPCADSEKIIAESDYDPERDSRFPADSVFCSHGAGSVISWRSAAGYMHIDSGVKIGADKIPSLPDPKVFAANFDVDEKELAAIMEREFGGIKRRRYQREIKDDRVSAPKPVRRKKDYLIVDGYNMIFAWEGLKDLAEADLAAARQKLLDLLVNYKSYVPAEVILVFDGYKMKGNLGERFDVNGVHVVYTPEGETGDMYIERLLKEIGRHENVRIATSDALIQVSALGAGVLRMPAAELKEEIDWVEQRITALIAEINAKNR